MTTGLRVLAAFSSLLAVAALTSAPSYRAAGRDRPQDAATVPIADFEADDAASKVTSANGTIAVTTSAGNKTKCLRWTIPSGNSFASIELRSVPADITPFRSLKFKARASSTFAISVRIETSTDNYLAGDKVSVPTSWQSFSLDLPAMRTRGQFDPKNVRSLTFVVFDAPSLTIELDDVELQRAAGGWRYTDKELLADLFGKERASKAMSIDTKHFRIFTDSAGAQGKFPTGLEAIYEFVKKQFPNAILDPKLPVYIFQSSNLYFEFCVRHGWTKAAAEQSAGHGSGDYFAAYYQSPESPTVVHELTHSIFHRTFGAGGGSWFQEGVAVYVENLFQKKSIAFEFSGRIRSGSFLPLKKFVAVPTLIDEKDPKGGAGNAGALYDEAGAFFEFMKRGPYKDGFEERLKKFAAGSNDPAKGQQLIESVLGEPVDEIESKWKAWGAKPPPAGK
jgi:hypothetical protein